MYLYIFYGPDQGTWYFERKYLVLGGQKYLVLEPGGNCISHACHQHRPAHDILLVAMEEARENLVRLVARERVLMRHAQEPLVLVLLR